MLAFTESSLRYDAKHSKKSVVGICGVDKTFWADELKENDVKVNSLGACEYVLNYYLEQNQGNKRKAIAEYKGLKNNKKVLGVVETILQKEKEIKELK